MFNVYLFGDTFSVVEYCENGETMSEMRYFIAVPIPNLIKDQLSEMCGQLKEELLFRKWVYAEDYHITLTYLGACSIEKIEQVKQRLSHVVQSQETFFMAIGSLGYFGQINSPRILWADVDGDRANLTQLQHEVEKGMAEIGFHIENRSYRPHVTLAKNFKGIVFNSEQLATQGFRESNIPTWEVDSVVLYRTELERQPMYMSESVFPFGTK